MHIKLFIVILCLCAFILPIIIVQSLVRFFPSCMSQILPMWFHRQVLKLLGIKVVIKGKKSEYAPTLMISNHWSWLDIPVLGAIIKGYFVAKSDIEGWPVFGYLSKLQNTIFVNRTDRRQVGKQTNEITDCLETGKDVILFAEGTSNDGNRILKFKSSLFAVAKPTEKIRPAVQPVTIYYNKLYGMPLGRRNRPFLAWYGDMDLIPHLKDIFNLGPVEVIVHFGETVFYDEFPSRKALSEHIENKVRNTYNAYATAKA